MDQYFNFKKDLEYAKELLDSIEPSDFITNESNHISGQSNHEALNSAISTLVELKKTADDLKRHEEKQNAGLYGFMKKEW